MNTKSNVLWILASVAPVVFAFWGLRIFALMNGIFSPVGDLFPALLRAVLVVSFASLIVSVFCWAAPVISPLHKSRRC